MQDVSARIPSTAAYKTDEGFAAESSHSVVNQSATSLLMEESTTNLVLLVKACGYGVACQVLLFSFTSL